MKKNCTELVFILDRSGSMAGLESDTIGGFNAMIEKQKKNEGDCWVSTVLFSDRSQVVHDRLPLEKVPPMTDKEYFVGGCTALLDAIGDAVKHIASIHKYARAEDVPEHTLFVITTDGMENASHRYTKAEVRAMVERQKERYGWEFLFLGANMDAISAARSFGIREDRAVRYKCDSVGTSKNFSAVSDALCSFRAQTCIAPDWSKEIEEDVRERGE